MPLDAGHEWRPEDTVTADQVMAQLRHRFTLEPDPAPRGPAPAEFWRITDPRPDAPESRDHRLGVATLLLDL